MEFLDIPLFDNDFFKMMFRFILNFAFLKKKNFFSAFQFIYSKHYS